MNKLKTFFYIFKQSITNINYYKEASKANFWYLFKYISLAILLYSIVVNAYFVYELRNYSLQWPTFYPNLKQGVYQLYPNDLEITVNNGDLSTNKNQLIEVKIPEPWKNVILEIDDSKETKDFISNYNLAVLDTNGSVENFRSYNTLALFTKNNVAYIKEQNGSISGFEVVPYEKDNKIHKFNASIINMGLQEMFRVLENQVFPVIKTVLTVLLFSLWIFVFLFMLLGMLIAHLFTSVLGLILAKILNSKLSYNEIYKMGMVMFPFFILVNTLFNFIPFKLDVWINLALYTVIVVLALKQPQKAV